MASSRLLPGRLLRHTRPPKVVDPFQGVQIDDPRLAEVLSPDAPLLCLYEGTLHGEGPIWHPRRESLFWSDVPNRRLLEWHPDGQVIVAIDATLFMNGNALDAEGRLVHCEHGRRCISRSEYDGSVEPIVTHYEGKRLNLPNDITVAARTLYVSDTSLSLREIPPGSYIGDKHEIIAFDVAADASLANRRFFCHTDHGYRDGFCVDGRGWLWTTAADDIHVWSPERERLGFIPISRVASNCCFGGRHMRRLFVAATDLLLAIDLSEAA